MHKTAIRLTAGILALGVAAILLDLGPPELWSARGDAQTSDLPEVQVPASVSTTDIPEPPGSDRSTTATVSTVSAEQFDVLVAELKQLSERVDALAANQAVAAQDAPAERLPVDTKLEIERDVNYVLDGLAREPVDWRLLDTIELLQQSAPAGTFGSAQMIASYCTAHYCRLEYQHDAVDAQLVADNLPLFLPSGAEALWQNGSDGRSTVALVSLPQ